MKTLNKATQRIFDMDETTFQNEIDSYFENCSKTGKPCLTVGLANHLQIHKQTMYDIRHDKVLTFIGTHHKDILEIAHQRIEEYMADRLFDKNSKTVTGAIFTLKANFGWAEKQQIDLNHDGKINIKFDE